jgi:hypothetical protein
MKKNDVKHSTLRLAVLLLVNHCKTQPVDRLVSYAEIKEIVQFHPRQTREGRAIMRRAIKDLLEDGFVFLVKRGYGIYLSEGANREIELAESTAELVDGLLTIHAALVQKSLSGVQRLLGRVEKLADESENLDAKLSLLRTHSRLVALIEAGETLTKI